MRIANFQRLYPALLLQAPRTRTPFLALMLVLSALSACSSQPLSARSVAAWFVPYRPDIVQGNVVTTEQISQIKPGMSRLQVRDILGSPLINDPFHAQRWDYVFTMRRQGYEPIQRSFFVAFEGDAVQTINTPTLPSENEFVALISRQALPKSVRKLELTNEERAALPAPKGAASAANADAAPVGASRNYPPLEP